MSNASLFALFALIVLEGAPYLGRFGPGDDRPLVKDPSSPLSNVRWAILNGIFGESLVYTRKYAECLFFPMPVLRDPLSPAF